MAYVRSRKHKPRMRRIQQRERENEKKSVISTLVPVGSQQTYKQRNIHTYPHLHECLHSHNYWLVYIKTIYFKLCVCVSKSSILIIITKIKVVSGCPSENINDFAYDNHLIVSVSIETDAHYSRCQVESCIHKRNNRWRYLSNSQYAFWLDLVTLPLNAADEKRKTLCSAVQIYLFFLRVVLFQVLRENHEFDRGAAVKVRWLSLRFASCPVVLCSRKKGQQMLG